MKNEYEFGELLMTTCELLERSDGTTFSKDELGGNVPTSWLRGRSSFIPKGTYVTFVSNDVDNPDANNIHAVISPMGRNVVINKNNLKRVDDVVDEIKKEIYE